MERRLKFKRGSHNVRLAILKHQEILDYMEKDYPCTLGRRLQHFQISYTDVTVDVATIKTAVHKELKVAGKHLGYRAMQQKIRNEHGLLVPRDLVYAIMTVLDPLGLEQRQ